VILVLQGQAQGRALEFFQVVETRGELLLDYQTQEFLEHLEVLGYDQDQGFLQMVESW
jgi:hypothetical protein